MADSIVQGLFGPTLAEIENQRQQQMQQEALTYAKLDPFQRASMGMYQAGQQFGKVGAGMLGLEDPMVAQSKAREQALTGVDLTSPEGIAAAALKTNDPRLKIQLGIMAKEMRDKLLQQQLETRKVAVQERKQEDIETDRRNFEREKLTQQYELAKQRAEDARNTAADRVAAQREANQIKLMLGQMMIAAKQTAAESKVKPDLPTPALKLQQEELDAIGTTDVINRDLTKYKSMIDKKELDLGLVNNLVSRGKNLLGASDPQSVAFANFKADMEKLRNDSLRLNKGTQTEGDAVRAWNELFENITDPEVVKSRLATIQQKNAAAAEYRKKNINVIRKNFKVDPFDFSEYSAAPAAAPAAPAPAPTSTGAWAIRPKSGG